VIVVIGVGVRVVVVIVVVVVILIVVAVVEEFHAVWYTVTSTRIASSTHCDDDCAIDLSASLYSANLYFIPACSTHCYGCGVHVEEKYTATA
jgi:hypothetical protein